MQSQNYLPIYQPLLPYTPFASISNASRHYLPLNIQHQILKERLKYTSDLLILPIYVLVITFLDMKI